MGDARDTHAAEDPRQGLAQIEGTSMLPTLRPGDEVVVDLETRKFRCGDLIVVRSGETLIAHRVIETSPHLRTRGDNAPEADPPVHLERVMGSVVELRRNGRRYSYRTPLRRVGDRLLGEFALRSLGRPRIGSLFRLALRCFT